jgi:methylamine dehydrogenase light chain
MKFFDSWLDKSTESTIRGIAQHTSRRGFLGKLAGVVVGGAATLPLLPVARSQDSATPVPLEEGDTAGCDYWRYCAIDGFLCDCCGGSMNSCPPGTEMSPITWIGTCENPVDGKNYIISYNDCCGKSSCGNCLCMRNEGDRPVYNPRVSNDLNWCLGTSSAAYHCSTAIVIGAALDE